MENKVNGFDDEIDLMEYFYTVWKYKKLLFVFVSLCLCLCIIANFFVTPKYEAQTTFFMPLDSGSSGIASMVGGYASMLGVGSSVDLGNYMEFLVESGRMAQCIKNDLSSNKIIDKKIIEDINLSGGRRFSKDKNGLFVLVFRDRDPKVALSVVKSYIKNIVALNEDLELSLQKKIITVLDAPVLPKQPVWPRKKLNLILTLLGSVFLGIMGIFLWEYIIEDFFKTSKNKKIGIG